MIHVIHILNITIGGKNKHIIALQVTFLIDKVVYLILITGCDGAS